MDYHKKSEVLKALGHPVRLKITYWLLNNDGCHVNKMVEEMGLPQSTVSQHLGILRSKVIIAYEKKGVQTCYSVIDVQVKKILEILDN
ncbi:MAG: metalloregulator ArsR/SmtB family transcription factor [Elusimicrobia bacterium]|nr:metalloregulator ArsR/SmtB family transcription factor [Candidatus Liberimonas magnetica]